VPGDGRSPGGRTPLRALPDLEVECPAVRSSPPVWSCPRWRSGAAVGVVRAGRPNGEDKKPASQVLADAKAALASARSLHLAGQSTAGGETVSLEVTLRGDDSAGTMTANADTARFVRTGSVTYVKIARGFYRDIGLDEDAAAADASGQWVEASTTVSRLFASFTQWHVVDRLAADAAGATVSTNNPLRPASRHRNAVQRREGAGCRHRSSLSATPDQRGRTLHRPQRLRRERHHQGAGGGLTAPADRTAPSDPGRPQRQASASSYIHAGQQ